MVLSIDVLVKSITPSQTVLLLGAGASVPSGAPSGELLAEMLWRGVAKTESQSKDLVETASLLVRRYSRRAIVDVIISKLANLEPSGGLLSLPRFGWHSVFTTNFDQLLERAYKKCGIQTSVFRSNYDFSTKDNGDGVRIYKIHGCITQDESLGHKASMILTESDYEAHKVYRQVLFSALNTDLLQNDLLIVGQSLKDPHLSQAVKDILAVKLQYGAPGQVYVLVFDKDDLRAPLLEDRGARIIYGSIDEFVHAMAQTPGAEDPPEAGDGGPASMLPISLLSTVYDASGEASATANVPRMFNGGSASYADIARGATFERVHFNSLVASLAAADIHSLTLTGAAGVGKTTFARQLVSSLSQQGWHAWEHRPEYALDYRAWAAVEANLRASDAWAVLFVDECTHHMRAINSLVDRLTSIDKPRLILVLSANSAQWVPRIKSPNLFSKGAVVELRQLEDSELHSMLNLVQLNVDVASLVHLSFKNLPRNQQFEALRRKCSADMFVCLKNIFENESLDIILLKEFGDLDESLQEYYRYVAALEAVGTRVHRQLIIRMLGVNPDQVGSILQGLSGIIDEYDISPKEGIYGWATRHIVIARKITEYKFSGLVELTELFERIIQSINPTNRLEMQSIRDLCDAEFGIGRLGDSGIRQSLYRQLIAIAPGERIPWHRLIRELLAEGGHDDVEYLIRQAQEAVGADSPIDRYRVLLLKSRARDTKGISEKDRVALLRKAYELALVNITRHSWDKFSYYALCDVAVDLVRRGENEYILDEALKHLRDAADRILDPEMNKRIREYEGSRRR